MEIVNEAEFYTLHPFTVQSEVHIEDREKQVSYLFLECLLSLTSKFSAFHLLRVTTRVKIYRDKILCIFLYFLGAEIAQSV